MKCVCNSLAETSFADLTHVHMCEFSGREKFKREREAEPSLETFTDDWRYLLLLLVGARDSNTAHRARGTDGVVGNAMQSRLINIDRYLWCVVLQLCPATLRTARFAVGNQARARCNSSWTTLQSTFHPLPVQTTLSRRTKVRRFYERATGRSIFTCFTMNILLGILTLVSIWRQR